MDIFNSQLKLKTKQQEKLNFGNHTVNKTL